ncbi:receptor-like protein EIX1 [Salvia hispanica]|uniref:receptor-like protein EIX1 n=1 Tax=Salvia hispanica TaxID=49212 RepID=UPI00200981BF|nr:receptor-like protein EIX1 [Salvia hispanica]
MLDLRAFSALTEVSLGGNNFNGSIPQYIGQLSELCVLDLSRNNFHGVVSETHLAKLDKLEILDLSHNSLVLHFAPDWSPTFQLNEILLSGCNVGPSFPKWIQTQKHFSLLDLSRANIADEAPTWLWSLSPLVEAIYLFDNQITGIVMNLSSSIRDIDLTNNSISGHIPLLPANVEISQLSGNIFFGSVSSICKTRHDQLVLLDISNNQLAAEVPNCWEKMPNLHYLNLANNSFFGEIPHSLGSLRDLFVLQLRGNRLSGGFPSSLGHCQGLELFDVAGNELTGEIPTWTGQMYYMEFLNLGRNELVGSIPVEICNLTYIKVLDLSVNNLSGRIPDCFNNFTSLAQENIPTNISRRGYILNFYYNDHLPNVVMPKYYDAYSLVQWKGHESEYRGNLYEGIDFLESIIE